MQAYHDHEWAMPIRDGREMWEALMLDGFQAGLSWITILRKREAFARLQGLSNPKKVARFTEADIAALLQDEGIVRSRQDPGHHCRRAQSTGDAGRRGRLRHLGLEPGRGKPIPLKGPTPAARAFRGDFKALKRRGFKFVGPVIVYAGCRPWNRQHHSPDCFRYKAGER